MKGAGKSAGEKSAGEVLLPCPLMLEAVAE